MMKGANGYLNVITFETSMEVRTYLTSGFFHSKHFGQQPKEGGRHEIC